MIGGLGDEVRRRLLAGRVAPGTAAASSLIRLASLVDQRVPVVGPPVGRRLLVVAPHPDDETIGAGGTLALAVESGARVAVVTVTDGEATIGSPHDRDDTGRRRREESRLAAALLGVADTRFLGLPDGGVDDARDELADQIRQVVDELDPDVVLVPSPLDRHADHLATTRVVAAVVAERDVEVWGYEAHVATTPTRVVDVTTVVERKRAALAAHHTAGLAMDLDATLGLNRWRSLAATGGVGWAEAFLALPAAAFHDLVTELDHHA